MEHIRLAATGLDNTKDADWTEDGRPSLKRVRQLAKDANITQEQLDEAVPQLRRVTQDKARTIAVLKEPGPEGKPDAVSGVMMIAIERGYYGGAIRDPDSPTRLFSFTGIPGRWMRPATKEEIKDYQDEEKRRQNLAGTRAGLFANEVSKFP